MINIPRVQIHHSKILHALYCMYYHHKGDYHICKCLPSDTLYSRFDRFDFYRIENYTPDLPWQEVRRVLADAFKVWSDVTDLTFTEVMHTSADIMIKFASKYHKDGYPFDGKGN